MIPHLKSTLETDNAASDKEDQAIGKYLDDSATTENNVVQLHYVEKMTMWKFETFDKLSSLGCVVYYGKHHDTEKAYLRCIPSIPR